MEEQKTKKSQALGVIAAVAGAIVGFTAFQHFSHRPPSIDQALVATTSQLNKNLPMMVDKETRLDNTMPGPDKTIIYRYTLINRSAAEVPKDRLITAIRPQAVANYKTSESMKDFRNHGVTMQYQYSDKSGIFITEFSVGPKDL